MGQKKNFFLWNIINMVKIIYFQKRCSDLLLLKYVFGYVYISILLYDIKAYLHLLCNI